MGSRRDEECPEGLAVPMVEPLMRLTDAMPATLEEQIRYLFDPELAEAVPDASEEKEQWIRRDLEELRDAALAIVEEEGDAALATIIGKLRYRIATRAPLSPELPARVKIMTLHSAEGLEGDAILAGLADQIVPGPPKANPNHERRILVSRSTLLPNDPPAGIAGRRWPRQAGL